MAWVGARKAARRLLKFSSFSCSCSFANFRTSFSVRGSRESRCLDAQSAMPPRKRASSVPQQL